MFQIVIPTMSEQNLQACLTSIHSRERIDADDVIVVTDPEMPGWTCGNWPCRFVPSPEADITVCWNTGFKETTKPFFIVCDDVRLMTDKGFTAMYRRWEDDTSIGWLLPAMVGERIPHSHVLHEPGGLRDVPVGVAHCAFFPRPVFEKVGLYDERFIGYGIDDVDYSLRVQLAGYRVCVWDGCQIWHGGVESVARKKPNFDSDHNQNWKRFIDKWGIKPISDDIQAYCNEMRANQAIPDRAG